MRQVQQRVCLALRVDRHFHHSMPCPPRQVPIHSARVSRSTLHHKLPIIPELSLFAVVRHANSAQEFGTCTKGWLPPIGVHVVMVQVPNEHFVAFALLILNCLCPATKTAYSNMAYHFLGSSRLHAWPAQSTGQSTSLIQSIIVCRSAGRIFAMQMHRFHKCAEVLACWVDGRCLPHSNPSNWAQGPCQQSLQFASVCSRNRVPSIELPLLTICPSSQQWPGRAIQLSKQPFKDHMLWIIGRELPLNSLNHFDDLGCELCKRPLVDEGLPRQAPRLATHLWPPILIVHPIKE
mmetsp:Transcript_69805/g.167586  ORF Transcript_69805/g.167586 Transcript_69805/m.167586 type:complete len:292 (-) Transcript_69805:2034-2909(-)